MNMSIRNRLSVIVTVFKCDDLLERCLDSLRNACGEYQPETIIVDNAAQMSTRAIAKSHRAIYYAMPTDKGFAGANNIGCTLASNEFVVLVNSDTIFHTEPFTQMIHFLDAHPNAKVIQGTVILKNGIEGQDGLTDDCGTYLTPLGLVEITDCRKKPTDISILFAKKVFYAYGALFMFRKNWVAELNGILFHEHFYAYYEEADFCHRTWLHGGEVWQVPTTPVDHAHTSTFKRHFDLRKIRAQSLYNTRFSLLTCLGWISLLIILPRYEIMCWCLAARELIKKRPAEFKGTVFAYIKLTKTIPLIFKIRKLNQANRTANDSTIFDTIMRPRNIIGIFKRRLKFKQIQ